MLWDQSRVVGPVTFCATSHVLCDQSLNIGIWTVTPLARFKYQQLHKLFWRTRQIPGFCVKISQITIFFHIFPFQGSNAGTGPKGYYRCRQIISTNLGKHRLTWHRSALPANPTFSRPRSWSVGEATLVVVDRSGWRRVLGASNPRPSAKGVHPYRKRACLEVLS